MRWLPELMLGTGAAGLVARLGLAAEAGRPTALSLAVSAFAAMQLLLLYAGAALVFPPRLRSPGRPRLAVVGLAALALVLVLASTGPQGYSRLRVPFAPLLAVLAGVGFAPLLERRQGRQ